MPEPHRIRLPGQVLDQIRSKEDGGEYGKDARFNRKRKVEKNVPSRKEKRKEERFAKKQKRQKTKGPNSTHNVHHQRSPKENPKLFDGKPAPIKSRSFTSSDPIEQLKALKQAKAGKKNLSDGIRIVKENELDEEISELEDFTNFDDFSDGNEEEDEIDEVEDPLAALKALKAKKNQGKESKDNKKSIDEIKIVKEDDLSDDFSEGMDDFSESDENENFDDFDNEEGPNGLGDLSEDFDDIEEEEADPLAKLKALKEAKKARANEDDKKNVKKPEKVIEATFVDPFDNDLEFYAKKLGLKDGKKSKLTKLDDDDIVGGILDGLDFDYLDESEGDENLEAFGSDDDILDEDDMEPKVKENPFVAPSNDERDISSEENQESQPSKYVPPALRRKLAAESAEMSAEIIALQRAIKGPLNKLSESNLGAIVNEISALYLNNPRQAVTETLTTILLESVIQQGRLLTTFVLLHATLIVAIYRLQGVDCGAYFVQTLIEKYEKFKADSTKSKEALNSASLLSSIFTFQLVSSKLLFDIIKELISDLSETNADLLLKIIRTSGNQMRSEDPAALKEIVILVTAKQSALSKEKITPRMHFLVDTITSLKNNKLSASNDDSAETTIRLKKFLGTFIASKAADPLQVSLDDIRNVETRGKWWLVGSAWKGQDDASEPLVDVVAVNDVLDSAEPNWLELARAQRMNTDIRRAIFISIMSANDYVDALTKLDKLALKKAQEREIPRILIHCAVVEPAWNPYYGILSAKLCDSHSYRKTFQFLLWDLIKSFDSSSGGYGDDSEDEGDHFAGFDDDEDKLKRIMNLGRLFGHLFAEGALPLHVLRTVNFVATSTDIKLFLEVLFVSFFDEVARKSQVHSIGVGLGKKGMSEQKFDDRTLIERLLKAKEEPALLKGVSLFINKRLQNSDFLRGKKQRKRVEWGVKSATDIIDEFVKEY